MSLAESSLVRPPALAPGDRVHVVSPAGPVVPEILADGLEILDNWGLEVIVDNERVYHRHPPWEYLAGSDTERHEALVDAWNDPKARAIMCSRGGYGAMRLLPHLDLEMLVEQPRLLVGFSDITALHLYLAGIGGLATLHGPVLKSMRVHRETDPVDSLERLRQALFAESPAPRRWTGMRTVRPGTASGPVFGGNLSLLIPLLGSPYCPSLDGAIVVLEDVGEQDYRIDRLLTALELAGDADLAGLVLGEFTEIDDNVFVSPDRFDEFLDERGARFDCPVVAGAPVGHEARNAAFPVGVDARLDADAGTLEFAHHAVRPPDSDESR